MASAEDNFKWPGEGFEGFPKPVLEDEISYSLYIVRPDNGASGVATREQFEKVHSAAIDLRRELLQDYIWQRGSFELEYGQESDFLFLHGHTNFSDSIEDEWLIVYLLRELSKQFQDLWIRVTDTDGEFLLAEAADALPRWLNPEVADNRVWIHNGNLLIIPPSLQDGLSLRSPKPAPPQSMSLQDALRAIASNPDSLLNSAAIQSEAFFRLRNYPNQIQDNLHHAVITIPRKLAGLLNLRPDFISPAVEAFYLRDPIALLQLQKKTSIHSQLMFPPEDLVSVSVTFPRVGYAQLRSQQFSPPPAWADLMSKNQSTISFAQMELGMKVTSGFELVVADLQNQYKESVIQIRRLVRSIQTGDLKLPSDEEIALWKRREDDESWLDVNFEDFERELSGSSDQKQGQETGFGDKSAQENLRKMVERFEAFLNDDTAGAEGVEDSDDDAEDDTSEDEVDADDEEQGVSFNEGEFARMMREMMGLPDETDVKEEARNNGSAKGNEISRVKETQPAGNDDSNRHSDDEEEVKDIQTIMSRIESELNAAGALRLDSRTATTSSSKNLTLTEKSMQKRDHVGGERKMIKKDDDEDDKHPCGVNDDNNHQEAEEEEEEEVNIDFHLAKNLLESFKAQAGLSGPTGNILSALGVRLPRDEYENH